jgi:hypothetical protein
MPFWELKNLPGYDLVLPIYPAVDILLIKDKKIRNHQQHKAPVLLSGILI